LPTLSKRPIASRTLFSEIWTSAQMRAVPRLNSMKARRGVVGAARHRQGTRSRSPASTAGGQRRQREIVQRHGGRHVVAGAPGLAPRGAGLGQRLLHPAEIGERARPAETQHRHEIAAPSGERPFEPARR
jgi:hypothetical protein